MSFRPPESLESLSLHVEHRIHDVLQDARARNVPGFGHVPNQEDGHPSALRHLEERIRTLAHLRARVRGLQ